MLVLLLAALALGAGLGLRDPAPPDEPRFVLAARSMVETGQWAVPMRGSERYGHKPPVFMWLQAGAWYLVRDWSIAFLLPSLLAALGTLWLVYDLARRQWGPRVATHATLALFVTLQFGLQAKRAQIDMVLVFLSTLSLWALARHLLGRRAGPMAALGGFAAGLGTVTKGVGFLPLLLLLPWRTLRPGDRGSAPLRGGLLAAGFVLGTLVWLGPLAIAVAGSDDPGLSAYLSDILLRQTAGRYADPWHHHQPVWYYARVVATLWLPGALLLPWLIPAWWRRLRRRQPAQWMLLGWACLVLLFFSLTSGKREVYIFPALPALCLAAAPLLPGLLRRTGVRAVLRIHAGLLGTGLLGLGVAGLAGATGIASRLAADRGIATGDLHLLFAAAGAVGLLVLAALAAWWRRPGTAVVVATVVLWAGVGIGVAPALDASSSARALMQEVAARIGPDGRLAVLAWREQHLLQAPPGTVDFGFDRPWHAQWRDAGEWMAADPDRRWLFVLDEALSPCVPREHAIEVGRSNRRDWLLVPGSAWPRGCETPPWPDEPAAAD